MGLYNTGSTLAKAGYASYQNHVSETLAPGATGSIIINIQQALEVLALEVSSNIDAGGISLYSYDDAGNQVGFFIPITNGSQFAGTSINQMNAEPNSIFDVVSYDTTNNLYKMVLKQPMYLANGLWVANVNYDSSLNATIATWVLASLYRG